MGTKWDEMKRSMARSFKTNWRLFKQSKLGLIGLGIITFFVILAVFAPFFTPYTTNYLAPLGDLYTIDNVTYNIPSNMRNLQWNAPMSILTPPLMDRPPFITGIFLYSDEGQGLLYPRDLSNTLLLRLTNHPWPVNVPQGLKTMKYLTYNHRIIGYTNRDVHLFLVTYEKNYEDINVENFLKNDKIISFPFDIKYYSNVWDYNFTYSGGGAILAFAVASGHNVSTWMWSYGKNSMTFHRESFISQLNFTVNDTIDGKPILLMANHYRYVIVPTEKYIYGYRLAVHYNEYSPTITLKNATLVWKYPMNGHKLKSPSSISVAFPDAMNGNPDTYDVVVGLCENNYGFGVYTQNGTQAWNGTIYLSPRDARITQQSLEGLHPTSQGLMMYGSTNIGNFIALFDDNHGVVQTNKTAYYILKGTVDYISRYDPGTGTFYVSTTEGRVYQIKFPFATKMVGGVVHVEGINQTKVFDIPGGSATPAVYLGKIFPMGGGSYIGVITKDNKIYLQASTGSRISTGVIPPFSYGRVSHNFYLFGTDYEGHDIWTWLVYGSRTSLIVGLTAAFISVIAGTFIGIISGFYGGWTDIVIMRLVDIILTLPGIVIMLLMAAVMGPSIWNIVIIISVLGWAAIARVIRAVTLSLKNRPFMDAARVAGASNARLMVYHIFPNVVPLTFLYMTFGVAGAILSEAALSFLGLGDPNAISWGMMLQFLRMYGQVTNPNAWGWLLMPGIFITLISLSFYLVGRAFDEIVNPRLRKR